MPSALGTCPSRYLGGYKLAWQRLQLVTAC